MFSTVVNSLQQAEAVDRIIPLRSSAREVVEKRLRKQVPRRYVCNHPHRWYDAPYNEWFCPDCSIQWREENVNFTMPPLFSGFS